MIQIRRNPSVRELRWFAALLFPGFWGLVAFLIYSKSGRLGPALVLAATALVISVAGFLAPPFMRFIYLGMIYATFPIGFVLSHLLLGLVYYGVLTLIGFALRLAGRDPMHRQFEPSKRTYWIHKEATTDTARYFRQH